MNLKSFPFGSASASGAEPARLRGGFVLPPDC